MIRAPAIAGSLIAALLAAPAAAGPLASLADTDYLACVNGETSHFNVVQALLSSAGLPGTEERVDAYRGHRLSELMNAGLKAGDPKWVRFNILANSLLKEGVKTPEKDYTITIRDGRPGEDFLAVRQLVNGQATWFVLNCKTPPPLPEPEKEQEAEKDPPPGLIIAKSLADADKEASRKRGFATLSYTRDYEAKDKIIETEVFIGLPSFATNLATHQHVRPYIVYQRRTGSDPLNDLTFGLNGRWWVKGNDLLDHVWYLSGEHETDDDFKSEVWRGEFVWRPVLTHGNDPCHKAGLNFGMSCSLRAVVDWQDVNDPGRKKGLVDSPTFTRVGADFRLASYWELKAGGSIELDVLGAIREPFDGKDGDAAFGEIGLRYVPSGTENVSFGVEYFEGEDPTSLEREKILKFTLGFRN